jgi:hypothetical protein
MKAEVMAADYPHKFARVTISGTCAGGAEIWNTGFNMGSPTADITGVPGAAAENIATAWTTFFTAFNNSFSNKYKTTVVKVAAINANGTSDTAWQSFYTYPTPLAGGGSTQALPPQITLAATMTSDKQRGLASKGRMYLPGLNAGINGDNGRIDSGFVGTLATAFKTFLDSVNSAADTPGNVILASKGHRDKSVIPPAPPVWFAGEAAWVTGCRLGDVYDTQRRRRDSLAETYAARVLA